MSKKQPADPETNSVAFMATCLVDALMPEVGLAALKVLAREGIEVLIPTKQVCCGQPLYKQGDIAAARRVGLKWLDVFESYPVVVSPSGSCVAHVRKLPEILAPGPREARRATAVAQRTFELSQYLYRVLGRREVAAAAPSQPWTYHPSCGLHRVLGEDQAPFTLLDSLSGRPRLPLPDQDECCGFGGGFSVSHPELSSAMLSAKLAAARKAGAKVLVAGDVGCALNLNCGAAQQDPELKVIHLAQALAGEDEA
jgi:L-lactate dehydrogenase complex protein LldE